MGREEDAQRALSIDRSVTAVHRSCLSALGRVAWNLYKTYVNGDVKYIYM